MKQAKLADFTRGWVIGNFEPTLLTTSKFEICIKHYQSGDQEKPHFHKVATEYTIVGAGKFRLNQVEISTGDIVVLQPEEVAHFECLETGHTIIIKIPSVPDDKYLVSTL